jgi:hypothetical protein
MAFPFPRPKSEKQAVLFTILSFLLLFFLLPIVEYQILSYFVELGLVDTQLIVSLVIVEVPLAIFMYYILGEHRRSVTQRMHDAIAKAQAISDFKHLIVVFADDWKLYDYPRLRYYVVNLATKFAFYVPDYIHDLVEAKVIRAYWVGLEQDKLNAFFEKHQFVLTGREPYPMELECPSEALVNPDLTLTKSLLSELVEMMGAAQLKEREA